MKKSLVLFSLLFAVGSFAENSEIPSQPEVNHNHHTLADTILKAMESYKKSQEKVFMAQVQAKAKAEAAKQGLEALRDACTFVVANIPATKIETTPEFVAHHAKVIPETAPTPEAELPKTDL